MATSKNGHTEMKAMTPKTEGVMPMHKAMAEGQDAIVAQRKVAGESKKG